MGYHEQVGCSNRRHAQRRAAMHPWRRRLGDWVAGGLLHAFAILLWFILLAPLWRAFL